MHAPGVDSPLFRLLNPRSLAFVGISAKGGAGAKMLGAALGSRFSGPLWPVNPNAAEILGVPCVPTLSHLPGVPDCLVVSVPAPAVLDVLEEAAALGVKAALVVSEGFADAGDPEGQALQDRLVALAESAGMAIAGPNCMGIASLGHGFSATMADVPARLGAGGVSLVSQSGGLLNAVAERAANRGIGINYLISMGNQAVLDLADYIDFLADDPKTGVVACIMEGAKDARRFRAAVERAARKKPLVVLKLGRSEAGQAATLAHTGTLAGRHEAYEALFARNGVAMVASLDELVETAMLFANAPLPAGDGLCLLTVSGGATSLIGDLGEKAGVRFPPLLPETGRRIGAALGVEREFANPVDTVGMPRLAREGALKGVVEALADDPGVDVIGLVLGMRLDGVPNHNRLVGELAALQERTDKPLMVLSFISDSLTGYWRAFAAEGGLPLLEDLETGLKAIRHLTDYALYRRRARTSPAPRRPLDLPPESVLGEKRSKEILGAFGLPVTREFLAPTPREAGRFAARIGGRVALKIQSPDILHKSDVGGVHLGATAPEAEAAAQGVLERSRRACPDARIEGILVQEMVEEGAEFILGMTRDAQFGPLIVLGGGGVTVELYKDATVALPPLDVEDAERMIGKLKVSGRLAGFRGEPELDRPALIALIVAFSDFVTATDGEIEAIDLNPVFVRPKGRGVTIADALIIKRSQEEDFDETLEHRMASR